MLVEVARELHWAFAVIALVIRAAVRLAGEGGEAIRKRSWHGRALPGWQGVALSLSVGTILLESNVIINLSAHARCSQAAAISKLINPSIQE